jgi:hypothetical protein
LEIWHFLCCALCATRLFFVAALFWHFFLAELCAMPQKPWAAKHNPLMFLPDRLPLCRFYSSSLELDEE